jgi:hypothetical protein
MTVISAADEAFGGGNLDEFAGVGTVQNLELDEHCAATPGLCDSGFGGLEGTCNCWQKQMRPRIKPHARTTNSCDRNIPHPRADAENQRGEWDDE